MSTKAELRRDALAARDALSMTARIEASLAIAEHAAALGEGGSTVAAYWPIRSEVDPRPLLFALHERGWRMALPIVSEDERIVFRELTRGGELVDAGFGTMGPAESSPVLDPDLVLLPLAAFDRAGNRLGYGRGHYDRTIGTMRARGLAPQLIGLAYEAQRVGAIPAEPHDMALHAVLTEHGLSRFAP